MNRTVLLAITAAIAGAVALGYYASMPKAVKLPPVPAAPVSVKNLPAQTNQQLANQLNMAIHDPFAVPSGFQLADSTALLPASAAGNRGGFSGERPGMSGFAASPASREAPPVLTGIAGNGRQRIALVRYGGKTQPYAINESIGSYKLVAVSENSATVSGPEGNLILVLGR